MKRLLLLTLTCLTVGQAFCAERTARFARDYYKPNFARWDDSSGCLDSKLNEKERVECAQAKTFWKSLYKESREEFFKDADAQDKKAIIPSIDYFATKECDKLPVDQRETCVFVHNFLINNALKPSELEKYRSFKIKDVLGFGLISVAMVLIVRSYSVGQSLYGSLVGGLVGGLVGLGVYAVANPDALNHYQEWNDIKHKWDTMENRQKGLIKGQTWENQTPEDYKPFVQFYNKHKDKIYWGFLSINHPVVDEKALRARVIAGHFQADADNNSQA